MQYIFIVALEFVLAFIGVALLIHFVADCCSCRHNIRQKSARYLPTSQKRHTFAPSNRTNNI